MAHLSAADLAEIEALAESDGGEHCRGPLLALVGEVRRLRGIIIGGVTQIEVTPHYGGGVHSAR